MHDLLQPDVRLCELLILLGLHGLRLGVVHDPVGRQLRLSVRLRPQRRDLHYLRFGDYWLYFLHLGFDLHGLPIGVRPAEQHVLHLRDFDQRLHFLLVEHSLLSLRRRCQHGTQQQHLRLQGRIHSQPNVCVTCATMMPNCTSCTSASNCTACNSGSYINSQLQCSNCIDAMPGCLTCTGSAVCVTCDTAGNFELNSSSKCSCKTGYLYDSATKSCKSCP
jgi:hypothetical protein